MTVERDNQLLQVFWDLADNDETKRINATQLLINRLLKQQKKAEDPEELCPDFKYTIGRLVGGLGSNRKFARVGFSTALSALLSQTTSKLVNANHILELMTEKLQLGNTKSEDREMLFGRAFCLLTLIESNRLFEAESHSGRLINHVTKEFLSLAKAKVFVHSLAIQGLCELTKKVKSATFQDAMWPSLSSFFEDGWDSCTPDMLHLLLVCSKHHPEACGKTFLKTNNWIPKKSKKSEIIGPHCFKQLARIIAETTPCQPEVNTFALDIMLQIATQGHESLAKFWHEFLQPTLINTSPERKCLAIKLAVFLLPHLSQDNVPIIWSKDILVQIYTSLLNKDHYFHKYSKQQLPQELSEKMKDANMSPNVQYKVLFQLLKSPGGIYLDSVTHSAIVSSVVGHLKLPALLKYISWLKKLFLEGSVGDSGIKELNLDVAREWSSTQLAHLVRMIHLPRNEDWISNTLKFMFFHGHFDVTGTSKSSNIEEVAMVPTHFMELSESTQSKVRSNFNTLMSWLNNMLPVDSQKNETNQRRIPGLMSNGDFWLHMVVRYADALLEESDVSMTTTVDFTDEVKAAWKEAMSAIGKMSTLKKDSKNVKSSEATALQLLLLHVALQLLSTDADVQKSAIDVAGDLREIIKERFRKGKSAKPADEDSDAPHWVEVIVEILLGMLSQESRSVRIIANQVFRLISCHLTKTGVQLILDVLKMSDEDLMKDKEDLDEDDDEEEEEEEEVQSDPDESHASDDQSDSESSEDEDADQSTNDPDGGVDEEFRRRIKEALGDVAPPSESEGDDDDAGDEGDDDSDADMSDDAMMRIDYMLSDIFQQRKKKKKATKKNNKLHVTHFQLRCVELLESFVQRQHDKNPLVLALVRPLLDVVELASRDPDKSVLAERATVVLRVKLCKMKGYPRTLDAAQISGCHDDMEAILRRCERANGGVFLSQLSSHCCMLLLRVLAGQPSTQEGCETGAVDVERVCAMYASALDDYMSRRDSKMQQCVLHDFVSRYPILARNLTKPLIANVKDAVLVFRKGQACQLLQLLFTCSVSAPYAGQHSAELVDTITDILSKICKQPADDFRPKHVSELLRLLYHPVQTIKSKAAEDDLEQWKEVSDALNKLLQLQEARRSQEITNLAWKVLSTLGAKRTKPDKSDKPQKKEKKEKKEKRKRKLSEGENDENATEEPKESRKARKRRVQKEKKKAKRGKGSKQKRHLAEDGTSNDAQKSSDSLVVSVPKKKAKKKNKQPKAESTIGE